MNATNNVLVYKIVRKPETELKHLKKDKRSLPDAYPTVDPFVYTLSPFNEISHLSQYDKEKSTEKPVISPIFKIKDGETLTNKNLAIIPTAKRASFHETLYNTHSKFSNAKKSLDIPKTVIYANSSVITRKPMKTTIFPMHAFNKYFFVGFLYFI